MKQFFAQLNLRTLPTPAQIWQAMEQGAAFIHELPYRFAAWLPSAPGLLLRGLRAARDWFVRTETVQEVLAVYGWMERKAEDIHELPYRFARWLPTVPERWRCMRQRIAAWAEYKDITPRLRLFTSLCLLGVAMGLTTELLELAVQPVEMSETVYLLTDKQQEPRGIFGKPEADEELPGLTISAGVNTRDAQLVLDEGQRVRVKANGETLWATTRHETVANLLRRLEVECSQEDMVVIDTSGWTPLISVQHEYEVLWQKTVPIDYDTKRVPNYFMRDGKEKVITEGQAGNILQTYRDIYRHGELAETLLASEEITEPVQEVVEYGTLVKEVSRSDRIKSVHYNRDGSGYLLFKSGKTMTFSEKVTCNATAYSIGSWTASGLPTKVGHIAVDPKVFPYGTRFYIYTNDGYLVYGNAVAADCGKAIKGYKIDLWFETYDEACWFGRRDCTVFVLD